METPENICRRFTGPNITNFVNNFVDFNNPQTIDNERNLCKPITVPVVE